MKNLLKAQYFLWFGSLAGILPYVSIFARNHSSVSPSQVGILYTILPFVAMVTKPIFCGLADRFNCHKCVLVVSMISTLFGYGILVVTPWFPQASWSWLFICICVLIANTSMGIVISMNDSIAMREVSNGRASYGSLRVFGTIGWGLLGLLAGVLNENERLKLHLPYLLPGIVMFIIVMLLDILFIIWFYNDTNNNLSLQTVPSQGEVVFQNNHFGQVNDVRETRSPVCKQVTNVFIKHPSILYYTFVIFVVGLLTAFHWSFFYWFIEDIAGQDTLLMGLCNVDQSFLGEVPFFLLSEWIVKTIGFNNALSLSLASIAVRYLSYGYLINSSNAYYVLIIELLQGPAYGLFYVVMTSIAQDFSLKCVRSYNKNRDDNQYGNNESSSSANNCINVALPRTICNQIQSSSHDKVSPFNLDNSKDGFQQKDKSVGECSNKLVIPTVITTQVDENGEIDEKDNDEEISTIKIQLEPDGGDKDFEKEIYVHPSPVNDVNDSSENIHHHVHKGVTLCNNQVDQVKADQDRTYATMQGFFSGLFEGAGLGVGALIAGLTIEKIGMLSAWRFAGYLSLIVCIGNVLVNFNLEKCPNLTTRRNIE